MINEDSCKITYPYGETFNNLKSQGQQNWRVTPILIALASEQKLSPLLIFEAKEGNNVKKLQALDNVESKKVLVYWQENEWNNNSIILKQISEICRKAHFLN